MLLLPTHLKYSLGDYIFILLHIPPYTRQNDYGLHLPVLIGLIFTLVGVIVLKEMYKQQIPHLVRNIVVTCIVLFTAFPHITPVVLNGVFYYSNSEQSYSVKDGDCSITIKESDVTGHCTFKVYNYGRQKLISVVPLLPWYLEDDYQIEFEERAYRLDAHSSVTYNITISGTALSDVQSASINGATTFQTKIVHSSANTVN